MYRVQKFFVTLKMQNKTKVEIPCKTKQEQTTLLATLSGAVTSAKATMKAWEAFYPGISNMPSPSETAAQQAAAPQAPAAPAVNPAALYIAPGTDPVKALQELKAARDAGMVDAATFDARRAELLKRIR
jgi:hypothetical protein